MLDQAATKIIRATIIAAVMNLVAKLIVAGKDIYLAYVFGVGDELDIFFVACLVPAFISTAASNSFAVVVAANLVRESEKDAADRKRRLAIAALGLVSLTLFVNALALSAISSQIIELVALGFSNEKLAATVNAFLLIQPAFVVGGVSSFLCVLASTKKVIALPALSTAITPIVVVTAMVIEIGDTTLLSLVIGTTIGAICELAVVLLICHRRAVIQIGKFDRLGKYAQALRPSVKEFTPMFLGTLVMGATTVVDSMMASWLPTGSVSTLAFGNKISSLVAGICSTALAAAVTPYAMELHGLSNRGQASKSLRQVCFVSILALLPLSMFLILWAEELTALLFQRGRFDSANAASVTVVLALSSLQIPFYVLGGLLSRTVLIRHGPRYLLLGAVTSLVVNIVLNYVLMNHLGVSGIALSTGIVYLLSSVYLYSLSMRPPTIGK